MFAVVVTTGPLKLGTVVARPIEFGPLAERTITRGTIVARARETRTILAAFTLLPGLVFAAITAAEILARRTITTRACIALLPRLGIAALATIAWAVAAIRRAPRKFAVALELAFRTIATRCVRALVAEFLVAEPAGGAGFIAVTAARRTVVTTIGRAITARPRRTLLAIARSTIGEGTVATRLEAALATAFAAAVVALEARTVAEIAARRITVFAAAEGTAVTTLAWRTAVAIALALKAALGKLLLGATRLAGPAFGRASITPAAGIVVFVAVARHE